VKQGLDIVKKGCEATTSSGYTKSQDDLARQNGLEKFRFAKETEGF
jgi:hypothetical protein